MRKMILAAVAIATVMPVTAASAQRYGGYGYHGGQVRQEQRECRRELRQARNRWEYQRELRECRREIAAARRDRREDRFDRRHRGW
jgi:hypothetical protein